MAIEEKSPRKYAPVQRLLHWLVAVMVIGVLVAGMMLGILGFKGVTQLLGGAGRDLVYNLHKTFGLVILAVMVIRLVVRLKLGAPDYHPPLERWQALASGIVHKLLYVCLFAMPILGWTATDAANYPVEFFAWKVPQMIDKNPSMGESLYQLHAIVGWCLLVLVIIHIGAALMHWLIKRDGVMQRMTFGSDRSDRD